MAGTHPGHPATTVTSAVTGAWQGHTPIIQPQLSQIAGAIYCYITSTPVTLLEHTAATRRASGRGRGPGRTNVTVHFQ